MDIMQYGFRRCVLRNFEVSQLLAKNMMLTAPNKWRPASNISKCEFKALQELKADIDITILQADKGRSTVIINTKDYESNLSILLSDSNRYEMLQKDPTPKFKRTENDSTMAKGGPNHYCSQTFDIFQKKSPRCMAYLRHTGRMSLYEQLSQAEEASH